MGILYDLFQRNIIWIEDKDAKSKFVATVDDNHFVLRQNNFPDEIMYTVLFENESIDFDDLPKKWKMKYL